jgi:hypothetical protein
VAPDRCVEAPGLVVLTTLDDLPVAARVDPDVVATLHQSPGTWHARVVDAADPCKAMLVPFDASEAPPAEPSRELVASPPRADGPPAWMGTGGVP